VVRRGSLDVSPEVLSMSNDHASTVSAPARDVTLSAFEEARPEADALSAQDIVQATTSTAEAVVRALSAVSAVRALLTDARKALPLFDHRAIDRFERNANALSYAQSRYLQARASSSADVATIADEAQRALDIAYGDLQALANRGMVDAARIESIKDSGSSRESLPIAIGAVVQLMAELREKHGDRLLMTEDEQHALGKLAIRLRDALAARLPALGDSEALDTRNRMFTLLRREFLELRRAVEYLRFYEDDADEILPSLFTRSKRKAKSEDNSAKKPTPAPEPAPASAPAKPAQGSVTIPQEDPLGRR
jgi:hypothetical protein